MDQRGIKKTNFLLIINDKMINENISIPVTNKVSFYILHLMALLRTITDIPSPYEDFAWRVIKQISTSYNQIDRAPNIYWPLYFLICKKNIVEGGGAAPSSTQLNQEFLVNSRIFCQMVKSNKR